MIGQSSGGNEESKYVSFFGLRRISFTTFRNVDAMTSVKLHKWVNRGLSLSVLNISAITSGAVIFLSEIFRRFAIHDNEMSFSPSSHLNPFALFFKHDEMCFGNIFR